MQTITSFGAPSVPPSPSQKIRRLDHGLLAGAVGFVLGSVPVAWALWHPLPGAPLPDGGLWRHLATYPELLTNTLSFGHLYRDVWYDDPAAGQVRVAAVHLRLLPACITGALLAVKWARHALRPQSILKHLSGPQLLEGPEAKAAAVRYAARERGGAKVSGFIRLHPLLDLSKRTWCRHFFIAGSVGSGKTQLIWPIVQQIRKRKKKLFLLDVKGDYTAAIKGALILSPWDRRSVYLDIAADVRTSAAASAFASAMIPREEGSNGFFSTAAELILTGCIRALQKRTGTKWHWEDLDFLLNLSAAELAPCLADYYAKAHPLLTAGDSTSANVMATLSSYTQTISQLAEAFKSGLDEQGRPRKRLSLVAWAKDDYVGCPTIIAHAGPDTGLTQRYLAAVIDTLVPTIMQLPDDVSEDGRAIFFVLDELSTIGKVKNLPSLIDKGRSKGCSVIVGVQDRAQLAAIHGENFSKALPSMIGSHIITQTQIGPTRNELAAMLGERRVTWTVSSPTKERTPITHEESRSVVTPADLTMKLGPLRGKQYPHGYVIRALACLGQDYLMLDWPAAPMPKKRRSHVPAAWTLPSVSEWEAAEASRPPMEVLDLNSESANGHRSDDTDADAGGDGESESGQPKVTSSRQNARMAPLVADVTAHVQAGLATMEIAA
jgi:hypothetical protein